MTVHAKTPSPTLRQPDASARPAVDASAPRRRKIAATLARNPFTVVALALGAATLAHVSRSRIAGDSWYTLLFGRIVSSGGLPHRNTVTVMAAGHPWVDQQWLAQLSFYRLWRAGGWPLALTCAVGLYVAAFAILAVAARRLGASDRSVAIVVIVAFAAGFGETVLRAQLIAYVLCAITVSLLLQDARRPSARVFFVLPVLALWANIHGSVLVGAGLVSLRGLTVLGEALRTPTHRRRPLQRGSVLVLAPWACVLVSPYALGLPGYYRAFVDNRTLDSLVTEWAPTDLRNQPIFFVLLVVAIWLTARSGTRVPLFTRLAILATAVLGLFAVRDAVWFALVAAAALPSTLDEAWAPSQAPQRGRLNSALAGTALTVAAVAVLMMTTHTRAWYEAAYPQSAVKAVTTTLRLDPDERVYASEPYSDWLLFEIPGLAGRVAYDIRFELLSSAQIRATAAFHLAAGLDWQQPIAGYGILALSRSEDSAALELLQPRRGTTVLYRGGDLVILRR